MKMTAYASPFQPGSESRGSGRQACASCLRSVSSSLAEIYRHVQSCSERLPVAQSFRTASPGDPDGHMSGDRGGSGFWFVSCLCVSSWRVRYVQLWTAATIAVPRLLNSLCPMKRERNGALHSRFLCFVSSPQRSLKTGCS